ncbi:MAG: tetratricopeptide repeat protein [Oscillatoriaceae cyanobacterium Prado104]|jgi:tetratricopeptide (TPR) repeat protein|nr:tetratricopeptide repeat protein [Oscillatoriaceae cyanobacterium Prado104]
MSFEATKGLFKFDFTDQHAILGVPLDAEFNDIRKRYMKIVRRLHSDTCPFEDEADKDWANQFLSKVVNPAYNKFSKDSDRKEYSLLLTAIVKRVAKEQPIMQVESNAAKQLASAADLQAAYTTAVLKLADKQYESKEQALEAIEQISELNMVYLLRKEQRGGGVISVQQPAAAKPAAPANPAPAAAAAKPVAQPAAAPAAPPPPQPKPIVSVAEQSCGRAQGFMDSKNYAKATLELKEALKREPKNSKAHAMLAMCYFQQGQATMAKLEVQKALASDPQEPTALEVKKKLEQPAAGAKGKKDEKPGGFFGSLFGGGKKK